MILRFTVNRANFVLGASAPSTILPIASNNYTINIRINNITIYNGLAQSFADILTNRYCGQNSNGDDINVKYLKVENSDFWTMRIDGLDADDDDSWVYIKMGISLTGFDAITDISFKLYGYDLGQNPSVSSSMSNAPFYDGSWIATPSITAGSAFRFVLIEDPADMLDGWARDILVYRIGNSDTITFYRNFSIDAYLPTTMLWFITDGGGLDFSVSELSFTHTIIGVVTDAHLTTTMSTGDADTQGVKAMIVPIGLINNALSVSNSCNIYSLTNTIAVDMVVTLTYFNGATWETIALLSSILTTGNVMDLSLPTDGIYKITVTYTIGATPYTEVLTILATCNIEECLRDKLPDVLCCRVVDACKAIDYYEFNTFAISILAGSIYFWKMYDYVNNGTSEPPDAFLYKIYKFIERIQSYCEDCTSPCDCSDDCNKITTNTGCY
jgi:hypothetical protein